MGEMGRAGRGALARRGYRRILAGSDLVDLEDEGLRAALAGASEPVVVVDRVAAHESERGRLADALDVALREGAGRAVAVGGEGGAASSRRGSHCEGCGREFLEPQPRLFSFNSPFGACPTCHGFGNLIEVDVDLVVPDKRRSLDEGAIEPWNKPHYRELQGQLRRFARRRGIPLDTPWSFLEEESRRLVLEGDGRFPGSAGVLPVAGGTEVQACR